MKVRNKRRMNRGLSLLLTGALTAGMLSGMPSLAEEAGAELDKELWTPPAETEEAAPLNTAGDLSLEELATAELAAEDIPEAVSLAEVEAKGHVHRLREQETDLNTVIFQNRDGTKTLYYFGENVKYEDETGRIRDKKNTLEEYMPKARYVADYSYVNSANDIQTYFPKTLDLETGVVLEYDGIRIEVSPDHALVKNPEAAEEAGTTDSTDGQAPVTGETAASTGTSSETTEQTADESTAGTRVTGEAEIAGTSGETAVTQPEKAMEETAPAQTGVTLPSGRADDTGRRTEATVQTQGTLTTEQPKEMIEVAPTVGEAVGEESRPTAVIPEQAEVQDGQLSEHITVETVQPETKPYVPRKLRVEAQSAASEKLTEMVEERPSDTVEYEGVFGEGTILRYQPLYSGFKEDLILQSYTGVHEFSFTVKTGGLTLVEEEGQYFFIDPLTGEIKAQMGNLFVYDSSESTHDAGLDENGEPIQYQNYYRINTIEQDEEYLITLVIDERYLTSENTIYPVTIDPTMLLNQSKMSIRDTTVYSNSGSNFGTQPWLFSGYHGSLYGQSQILIQFPGLMADNVIKALDPDQIINAQVALHNMNPPEKDYVAMEVRRVLVPWDENTANCTFGSNYANEVIDTRHIWKVNGQADDHRFESEKDKTDWYKFYFTSLLRDWMSGKYSAYGLSLITSEERAPFCKFESSESAENRPKVIINYNAESSARPDPDKTYFIRNKYSGYFLDVKNGGKENGNPLWQYTQNNTVAQQFKFEEVGDGSYFIHPQNAPDKVLALDSSSNKVVLSGINGSQRDMWYLRYQYDSVGGVSIVNKLHWDTNADPQYTAAMVTAGCDLEAAIKVQAFTGNAWERWELIDASTVLVDRIELDTHDLTVNLNGCYKFSTTVYPSTATNKAVIYSVPEEDRDILSVDILSGRIYPKKPGIANVEVRSAENSLIKDICTVRVISPASGIELNTHSIEMQVGEYHQLSATIYPETAHNKDVIYSVPSQADQNIVSVDSQGKIHALDVGSATVVVTSADNSGLTDICRVTVKSPDPFHPTNIEYIRIKKIHSIIDRTVTTVSTKSYLQDESFFTARDENGQQVTFVIDAILIHNLNAYENAYNNENATTGIPLYAHLAKEIVDQLVKDGIIESGSTEYYGIWVNNTNRLAETVNAIQTLSAVISVAYTLHGVVAYMQSMKLAPNSTVVLNNSKYVNAANQVDDCVVTIENGLSNTSYTNKYYTTAEKVNTSLGYSNPPYKGGTPVAEFTQTQSRRYVRVYVSEKGEIRYGKWIMRAEDVQGLSAQQIKDKFALEKLPTHICDVNVPSGTRLHTGIASEIDGWGKGGGLQYDIIDTYDPSWFVNGRTLP